MKARSDSLIFILNNSCNSFKIKIDDSRKIYINQKYDISLIEINQIDNINSSYIFDIDENIYKNVISSQNESICIYPLLNRYKTASGIIKSIRINNSEYYHTCSNLLNYLGNPIINSSNDKVIGIYIDPKNNSNNNGIFIKKIIENFIRHKKFCNFFREYGIDIDFQNSYKLIDKSLSIMNENNFEISESLKDLNLKIPDKGSYLESIGFFKNHNYLDKSITNYVSDIKKIAENKENLGIFKRLNKNSNDDSEKNINLMIQIINFLFKLKILNISLEIGTKIGEFEQNLRDVRRQIISNNYQIITLEELKIIEKNLIIIAKKIEFNIEMNLFLNEIYMNYILNPMKINLCELEFISFVDIYSCKNSISIKDKLKDIIDGIHKYFPNIINFIAIFDNRNLNKEFFYSKNDEGKPNPPRHSILNESLNNNEKVEKSNISLNLKNNKKINKRKEIIEISNLLLSKDNKAKLKFAILMNNNQNLNLDEFKIDSIDFIFLKFKEEINSKERELNPGLKINYYEDLYEIIFEKIINVFCLKSYEISFEECEN